MEDQVSLVEATTKELLDRLGFPEAGVTAQAAEEVVTATITVPTEESGILIGFHGETLAALQLITAQMVYKKLGRWVRIIMNIGDYREKREQALREMAMNAAERAKITNQPVSLPFLTSSERRLIHLILADDPEVETVSQGEGRDRRLTVHPKKAKNQTPEEG